MPPYCLTNVPYYYLCPLILVYTFGHPKKLNLTESPYEKKTNLFCDMCPGNVTFIKIDMGATGRRHPSPDI
jgi:hypothetical protein